MHQRAGGLSSTARIMWDSYVQRVTQEANSKNGFQEECGPKIWENTRSYRGTVLLYHGLTACTQQYEYLAPLLASKGFVVLAPTIPGHGLRFTLNVSTNEAEDDISTLPGTSKEYVEFAEEMNAIMAAAGGETAVGGLSLGGALATYSAIKGDYTRQLIIAPYFRARGIGDTILNLIKIFPWRADQRQGWGDECEARRWLQRDGYCQFTGRQLRACRDFGLQALSISKTKVTPGSTQIVFVDGDDAVQEGPIELLARTMGIDFIGGRSPYYCGLEKPIPHSFLSDKDNPNMNMYWLREANQMIADFLADGIPFPVEGRTEGRQRNRCRLRCTDSTCEQIWKP